MLGGEDVYERVFVAGHGWLFCDLVNGSMPPVGVDSKQQAQSQSMGRLYIYLHEWLIIMVNVGKYTYIHSYIYI